MNTHLLIFRYKKVFAVKPSEIINWRIGTRKIENEYWKWILGTIELETSRHAPLKNQIHEDLIETVKEELVSDVPISIFKRWYRLINNCCFSS